MGSSVEPKELFLTISKPEKVAFSLFRLINSPHSTPTELNQCNTPHPLHRLPQRLLQRPRRLQPRLESGLLSGGDGLDAADLDREGAEGL
jgi:hypothetical protein